MKALFNISLLTKIKFRCHFNDNFPLFYFPKKSKNYLREYRAFNKPKVSLADTLTYPGLDQKQIFKLYRMVNESQESNYSTENIALLVYNFANQDILTNAILDRFYPLLKKFKGEYSVRSIFGCLHAAFKMNHEPFFKYFMNQIESAPQYFTPDQVVQLMQVMYQSTLLNKKQKKVFWQKYLKENFMEFMTKHYKQHHPKKVFAIMNIFKKYKIYDEQLWNSFFRQLQYKKGWKRTQIYEELAKYRKRFPEANQLYQRIQQQIQQSSELNWRYNLKERRLYTNIQMMEKSNDNVQLNPTFRSWFPLQHLDEMIQKYRKLKESGSLKQQQQIDEDKAKSLSYALYNKYTIDKQSKFGVQAEDYKDMFGMDEQELKRFLKQNEEYEKQLQQELKQIEQQQENQENQNQQQQQEQQSKE